MEPSLCNLPEDRALAAELARKAITCYQGTPFAVNDRTFFCGCEDYRTSGAANPHHCSGPDPDRNVRASATSDRHEATQLAGPIHLRSAYLSAKGTVSLPSGSSIRFVRKYGPSELSPGNSRFDKNQMTATAIATHHFQFNLLMSQVSEVNIQGKRCRSRATAGNKGKKFFIAYKKF